MFIHELQELTPIRWDFVLRTLHMSLNIDPNSLEPRQLFTSEIEGRAMMAGVLIGDKTGKTESLHRSAGYTQMDDAWGPEIETLAEHILDPPT